MYGKTVLCVIGILLFFAAEGYCGKGYVIELKNGNSISANSCRVQGKKLVMYYPLGKACIPLATVSRILLSETGMALFQEKGQARGHNLTESKPSQASNVIEISNEPVEIWNADKKQEEADRLIEKLAEAEANGVNLSEDEEDKLFSSFTQEGGQAEQ